MARRDFWGVCGGRLGDLVNNKLPKGELANVGIPFCISLPIPFQYPGNVYPIAPKMFRSIKKKDQKKIAVNASFTYQVMKWNMRVSCGIGCKEWISMHILGSPG